MKNKGLSYFLRLQVDFLWLLCMVLCSQLHAQEHLTRNMLMLSNLNTDNGLSSARVYSIVEAEDGAMWISTKRGVDRYNGQQVRNYTLATDMQFSDASGRNIKLTKDSQQHIYAYDNKGKIYIYNKVKDTFQLQVNLMNVLGGSVVLNDLLVDDKGYFWMALDRGVYMMAHLSIAGSKDKTAYNKGKYILKNTYVNHIRFFGKQLLIGSPSGVFAYSQNAAQPRLLLRGYSVLSSYHDVKAHQIWLGTFHRGILLLDERTWKPLSSLTQFSSLSDIPLIPVRSIIPYDAATILMAVDGAGVYAYDKKTCKTSLLLNTDGRPENVLHGNGVYTLCKDHLGDLWMGSYSGGVDMAIPMEHTLEIVRHEYLNSQSLINNGVNDVMQSVDAQGRNSKIWYATDKGVSIYDEQTHLWHHSLYNKVALTLCQTADGKVLVGTYGDGIFQVHADGSSSRAYSVSNGKLKTDYVYSIFKDSEGGLWIGCLDGNLVHIPSSLEKNGNVDNSVNYLPINEVQSIVESPDKKIIAVGTTHGCYRIDKRSLRVSRFFYPSEFPSVDYNFFVNAMDFQDARHIWIATDGGGLYLYDWQKQQVKNYTISQSLPSNTIYALIKTPIGKVWMSTDKGLAFIDHGKMTNLNFFKGLEREYKRMAVVRTQDGRMIFGSSEGAVVLASKFARGLNYKAPLHITGVEVEGKTFDEAAQQEDWNAELFKMLQTGKMSFSHSENTLIVHFESINYQYQHDIQYQYYLEGYDHQWSVPSSYQQARFATLPPGSYTLHVKAMGRSNGRILGESTLRIHIAQPWWNSWWAWIVYLSIFGAIVYFGWDYYRERLHRKYYDDKINFFVNTAHNIRTPLSLVLAPLADLTKDTTLGDKSRKFLEMALRNGDKLLRMVTELLDFQKIAVAKTQVHLQNVELSVLLRQQVDKFHISAQEKHISLRLTICGQHVFSTDLSMMDLIFENLLSNAVKYTPVGGTITVSASIDEVGKQVCIQVSDTGIGIPKSEARYIFQSFFRASNAVNSQEMGSGLGLMLTRQLVQKLGGKLTFESEEGKGSAFLVVLPDNGYVDVSVSSKPSSLPETSDNFVSTDEKIKSEESLKDTLLFVDDNEDLRQYIRMAFADQYHVVDVESGETALKYLSENGECDIVVSDVMMPGMQGDELCRSIKENKETSWLPVILLTAKAGRDFMIEVLNLGADDYIAKPFDSAILASKIASILKNRRHLSQYYIEQSLTIVRGGDSGQSSQKSLLPSEPSVPSTSHEKNKSSDEKELELDPMDQAFVEKATRLVLDNLSDINFNIDRLCREMAMSRTLFYGKLKTLTGQGPQDFIRLIRLEQAAQYLKQGDSVLDVSVKTGFVNVKYFSTVFKKQFGVSPSKYD
jgi:putative two-component system sensor histidine kinase/response regulator hybrid